MGLHGISLSVTPTNKLKHVTKAAQGESGVLGQQVFFFFRPQFPSTVDPVESLSFTALIKNLSLW